MKKMTKIMSLVTTALLSVALIGCGGSKAKTVAAKSLPDTGAKRFVTRDADIMALIQEMYEEDMLDEYYWYSDPATAMMMAALSTTDFTAIQPDVTKIVQEEMTKNSRQQCQLFSQQEKLTIA